MFQPVKEGIQFGGHIPAAGKYRLANVSRAATLADVNKDYAVFTTGLLSLYGEWPTNPVLEYVTQHSECQAQQLELPGPIFSGFGEWNRRVLLCPRDTWEGLCSYIKMSSYLDRDKRRYRRVIWQQIPVPDCLAIQMDGTLSPPPVVTVFVFGVNGEANEVAMRPPGKGGSLLLFHPYAYPPNSEAVKLAEAFFREDEKPFRAVDPIYQPEDTT